MLPVQPQPDGRNDSTVTLSASPGLAPSTNTGPVTGLTRARSSLTRSAAVDALVSCPDDALTVSKCTLSPGAIFSVGLNALFQPWWMCWRWIVCCVWSCALKLASSYRDGERTVDHQIRAGDAARHRAGDEHHAVGDLFGGAEAAGGVDLQGRREQVGHVLLDRLPDAAVEVGVAR